MRQFFQDIGAVAMLAQSILMDSGGLWDRMRWSFTYLRLAGCWSRCNVGPIRMENGV